MLRCLLMRSGDTIVLLLFNFHKNIRYQTRFAFPLLRPPSLMAPCTKPLFQ